MILEALPEIASERTKEERKKGFKTSMQRLYLQKKKKTHTQHIQLMSVLKMEHLQQFHSKPGSFIYFYYKKKKS